jgi:hypothetical protein
MLTPTLILLRVEDVAVVDAVDAATMVILQEVTALNVAAGVDVEDTEEEGKEEETSNRAWWMWRTPTHSPRSKYLTPTKRIEAMHPSAVQRRNLVSTSGCSICTTSSTIP